MTAAAAALAAAVVMRSVQRGQKPSMSLCKKPGMKPNTGALLPLQLPPKTAGSSTSVLSAATWCSQASRRRKALHEAAAAIYTPRSKRYFIIVMRSKICALRIQSNSFLRLRSRSCMRCPMSSLTLITST